jgi:hypothetical protein
MAEPVTVDHTLHVTEPAKDSNIQAEECSTLPSTSAFDPGKIVSIPEHDLYGADKEYRETKR